MSTVVTVVDNLTRVGVVDGLRGPAGEKGERGEPGAGGVGTVNNLGPDPHGNVQVTVHVSRSVFDLIEDPDPDVMYFIEDE